jgi:hypothetical protein
MVSNGAQRTRTILVYLLSELPWSDEAIRPSRLRAEGQLE